MLPVSNNNIWGNCENPHKKGRASGGSSGGEASLVRAGGSPIGIGNDVGGSIRIPANFCGVYGFKPSWIRENFIGCAAPYLKGKEIHKL